MRPVRVALFAPGSKERVLAKALESGADAVLFDLEDSVPVAAKAEARMLVAHAIDGAAGRSSAGLFVRVNAASTGLLEDDLAAIVRATDNDQLAKIVTEHIRGVPGITTSETLIAFRVYSRHDLERMFSIGMEKI